MIPKIDDITGIPTFITTQLIRKLVLQTANMIVHIWQTFIHVSTLVAMHPK